jgi:ribose transport system substrate-binding protein
MMGKKAANNAYRLIKKKKVSAKVIVPVSLVGKNNISDYDLSGWQ